METLTKELSEIDFHRERIRLTPLIIENSRLEIEYWDLYFKINPEGNLHLTNPLLEARKANSNQIEFFSKEFAISEELLKQRGIDPYPPSKEELEEFEKEFPDPYRWRVPAYIREPLKKLFRIS